MSNNTGTYPLPSLPFETGAGCGTVNPAKYGAIGNGTMDCTYPFQRAIAEITAAAPFNGDNSSQAASGGKLCISPGRYYLRTDALVCRVPITIEGAGEGTTILEFHGDGNGLDLRLIISSETDRPRRAPKQTMVKGLTIRKPDGETASATSVGLWVGAIKTSSVKPQQQVRIEECGFSNFHTLLHVEYASVFNVKDNYFRSPSPSVGGEVYGPCGVLLSGVGGDDGMINENYFDFKECSANTAGIINTAVSGLRLVNNKFTGEHDGDPDGPAPAYHYMHLTSGTYILMIEGNSFESAKVAQVYFGMDAGQHSSIQIHNNQFSIDNDASKGVYVNIDGGGGDYFAGLQIHGNLFQCTGVPAPGGNCIKLVQGNSLLSDCTIQGNTFGTLAYPVYDAVYNGDCTPNQIGIGVNSYNITAATPFALAVTPMNAIESLGTGPASYSYAPSVSAYNSGHTFTNKSSAAAAAGGAAALPATPQGYLSLIDPTNTEIKIPFYL